MIAVRNATSVLNRLHRTTLEEAMEKNRATYLLGKKPQLGGSYPRVPKAPDETERGFSLLAL